MKSIGKQNLAAILLCVLMAIISFFVLAKMFSGPSALNGTYNTLTEKQNTIAEVSGITIAAASILDLVPGGEALAKELVELGGYFIVILTAIYLEKILVSIGGVIAFKYLVPTGLAFIALYNVVNKRALRSVGIRLISVGLIIFILVPASVKVSTAIENNRELYSGQQDILELNEEIKGIQGSATDESNSSASDNKNRNWLDKAKDKVSGAVISVKEIPSKIKAFPDYVKGKYDAFMDFIAFFIVTTCVIPILVLILLIEIMKLLLGYSGKFDYGASLKAPGKMLSSKFEQVKHGQDNEV